MALYKDYQINGGTVTVNTDGFTLVVHTDLAVWAWSDQGHYIKFHIEDGVPVTSVSKLNKDGGRDVTSANWQEKVDKPSTQYVTIDVEGESWAKGLVEDMIEQIQQQTKDGRVILKG